MEINIGNLLPGKMVELKTEYMQIIQSEDMSYCFSFIQSYPKLVFNNANNSDIFLQYSFKGIKWKINIFTKNQLTRFIVLNKRKDISYDIKIIDNLTFAKVNFHSKNLENNQNQNKKDSYKFKSLPYSCLKILFRTENMNQPILYAQYDELKNETSYLLHYMFSNTEIPSKFLSLMMNSNDANNKEKLENYDPENFVDEDDNFSYYQKYGNKSNISFPSCYIFIVDQSGSMYGKPIQIVRQTIMLFLKSLPFNLYFQVICFGTDYKKYNEAPFLYTEKNINEIIDILSGINADFGGTNLYKPLEEVYKKQNQYIALNLPIHIIIITDGKVSNAGNCANIIFNNKDNFKVHVIGIGEDYDRSLIKQSALVDKG